MAPSGSEANHVPTLHSRVLEWTTSDIGNSKLFKKQLQRIPKQFSSTAEYLGAFRVPCLEEVRAQLHQALEKTIEQTRSSAIVPARVTKMIPKKPRNSDQSMRTFNLTLLSRHSQPDTAVRSSDLILLSCGKVPEWDPARKVIRQSTDQETLLLKVVYAEEGSPEITATAYLPDGSPMLVKLDSPSARSSTWFAVLLGMNLIPADRIWSSINVNINSKSPPSGMSVIHDLLQIHRQVVPKGIDSLNLPQTPEAAGTLQRVEEYCDSRRLNNSQKDALKSTIAGLLTTDVKCHVRMVQGPPGTGKTAMLVSLISVLGCLRRRTLVSAPTNAAVVELCKRTMSFFEGDSAAESKEQEMFSAFCSRSRGSQVRGEDSRYSPLELCDVVLTGSEEKMGVAAKGTRLDKVFLPSRIERLTKALGQGKSGWKGCVESMEEFLSNAPAQFESEEMDGSSTEVEKLAPVTSFWRFARRYMIKMQFEMEEHLMALTTELPRCYINERTCNAMISTLELMKSTVQAMPSEAPSDATTWFDRTSNPDPLSTLLGYLRLSRIPKPGQSKEKYIQARDALLNAFAERAGCNLLVSKKNPQGCPTDSKALGSQCLKSAILAFSTVSGAGSPLMAKATFECAIVDEASQLVEAESTIMSGKTGLKQLILVGDHKQLPATVISKVAKKIGYGRSLFERLQSLKHGCRHMLNTQYRMKPEISQFPHLQFYASGVKDGANVVSKEYGVHLAGASPLGPYAFVNCELGAEVAERKGWKNPEEVTIVTELVKHLGRVCEGRGIKHLSIGVISPYAMQVEAVKQSLRGLGALHRALDVEVKSVDGFQGNERDVIIFSAVRANHTKQIGFVNDERRLNVAITRGRYCVWIVGNAETLSGGGKIWKTLIKDAKARECFHDRKSIWKKLKQVSSLQ